MTVHSDAKGTRLQVKTAPARVHRKVKHGCLRIGWQRRAAQVDGSQRNRTQRSRMPRCDWRGVIKVLHLV